MSLPPDVQKLMDAVDLFAIEMKSRLLETRNQNKSGWSNRDNAGHIKTLLDLNNDNLGSLLFNTTPSREQRVGIREESIDVANLAMFLWYHQL